jgi:hypothetical protein
MAQAASRKQPSCHAQADAGSSGSKPATSQNSCFAKKPFSGKTDSISPEAPVLHLAYWRAALAVIYELPQAEEESSDCQGRSRDWAFTPEVSLGPALRSLAPPLQS